MIIKGLQKLTLLDFPGRIACTVFTHGCNLRCPFCHNASLVVRDEGGSISEEELFAFLEKRRGMLEGVCVTGGEPTLYPDLENMLGRIRELGYLIKLDTNGYRPERLISCVERGLVDYVAMDIKSSKERYAEVAGIPSLDISKIEDSAAFLLEGKIPFEFRTTVVKELHSEEDFVNIGRWLGGEEKFFLQGFSDSGDLIFPGLHGYDKSEMEYLLNVLKVYVPNAEIRGQ